MLVYKPNWCSMSNFICQSINRIKILISLSDKIQFRGLVSHNIIECKNCKDLNRVRVLYWKKQFVQSFKMKRSGKTNRAEPSDMSWVQSFPDCARLFLEAGWLSFFEKLDGYRIEVSYKFAQCLDKDIFTFDTLKIELTR